MRALNRWGVLAVVIAATTVGMMAFAAPFPLLTIWIRDLGITRGQAGLLTGLWYLPGIVVALPAGWAFDRYPVRRVLVPCWMCIVVGMATMALAPGFTMLCVGRLIFSIGMNAHMVGAPKLVGSWFAGRRNLGLAMGLYTLSFTAGVFLSLNVLGRIGQAQGWRPAISLLAVLAVVGLVLVSVLADSPVTSDTGTPRAVTEPTRASGFHPRTLPAGAWILAIAYFGYSIGTEGYLTFAPDYLVQRGLQLATASSIVGAYALIAFVLKPVLSSFLIPSRGIAYVMAATVAALASVGLLLVPSLSPVVSSAVLGVSLALGMPAFIALPSFLLPATTSGQGYGLFQMFYSLGFFAQPLVGITVDRTGNYAWGFAVVALYTALGFAATLPLVRRLGDARGRRLNSDAGSPPSLLEHDARAGRPVPL